MTSFESLALWIGLVADIIGLGVFIYAAFRLWRTREQYRHYIEQMENRTGGRPCALIVDVMGSNITKGVQFYLEEEGLGHIPAKTCLHESVTKENFQQILKEVREMVHSFVDLGASEVHLFYRGPVTLAAGIGAVVSNMFPTHLYSYEGGTYVRYAVTDKGLVKGFARSEVVEAEEKMLEV